VILIADTGALLGALDRAHPEQAPIQSAMEQAGLIVVPPCRCRNTTVRNGWRYASWPGRLNAPVPLIGCNENTRQAFSGLPHPRHGTCISQLTNLQGDIKEVQKLFNLFDLAKHLCLDYSPKFYCASTVQSRRNSPT
jgi:hypothetical protein